MVATPAQVDGVLFGEDPATSSLDPGAVVMIMATVVPAAVQRWAERLVQQQVAVVDAPVSGGVRRAAEGDLPVMVGGAGFCGAAGTAAPRRDGRSRACPWDQHPVTVRR